MTPAEINFVEHLFEKSYKLLKPLREKAFHLFQKGLLDESGLESILRDIALSAAEMTIDCLKQMTLDSPADSLEAEAHRAILANLNKEEIMNQLQAIA